MKALLIIMSCFSNHCWPAITVEVPAVQCLEAQARMIDVEIWCAALPFKP